MIDNRIPKVISVQNTNHLQQNMLDIFALQAIQPELNYLE